MNTKHAYTTSTAPLASPSDAAWEVFLSDPDDELLPEEDDFWIPPDEFDDAL